MSRDHEKVDLTAITPPRELHPIQTWQQIPPLLAPCATEPQDLGPAPLVLLLPTISDT